MRGGNYKREKPDKYNIQAKTTLELYLRKIFTDIYRQQGFTGELVDPPTTYDQLTGTLPYAPDLGGYNEFILSIYKSCHVGQLKLLVAELNALNKFTNSNYDHGIVIYAGSAPSMKLLFLMRLYPNIKFLLVDPNEFFIYDDTYDLPHYVRQDPKYVEKGGVWKGIHTDRKMREYKKDEYVYLSCSDSDMYTSKVYQGKNCLLFNSETQLLEHMEKPNNGGTKYRRINEHVGEFNMITPRVGVEGIRYCFATQKHRVFMVEEYFTNDIAQMVAEVQKEFPTTKVMFWSDIRTNLENEWAPKDEDIMLNNAWTYVWMRIMNPTLSMLKFRLPFFNEPESIDISKYQEFFDSATKYGLNWNNKDWLRGEYPFFAGEIELQCWQGAYSKETRMFVTQDAVINNEIVFYNVKEYDEKFNFFNNITRFSLFYANPLANEDLGFDHCYECSATAKVFIAYMAKNPKFDYVKMLYKLNSVLKIRIKDRNIAFGHGHLFPEHGFQWMLRQIKQSNYETILRERH